MLFLLNFSIKQKRQLGKYTNFDNYLRKYTHFDNYLEKYTLFKLFRKYTNIEKFLFKYTFIFYLDIVVMRRKLFELFRIIYLRNNPHVEWFDLY